LKQGDRLALLPFGLLLEYVIRKLQIDTRHTLEYKSMQGYADDINLMGRSLRSVEEISEALEMEGKEVGLKINKQKTKVLIQSKERRYPEREISIGTVKLEVASNFTYLGTRLTNKNEELKEIQRAGYRQPTELTSLSCH
jgi:beta-xylosidase